MAVKLTNQVVLVLGASSGIGREATILFAREGARVMAAARREERLRALQQELAADGHKIEIATADVTKVEELNALAKQTVEKLGPIDILVYSSGVNTKERYMTVLTPATWENMISVNMNGAFYATQAVLPAMRERKSGHLIYVASISGLLADVSGASYQASKRGVVGMAHAIRVEERANGIRTCVICPGLVDTELLGYRPVQPTAETLAEALKPQDVAEAILAVAKLPAHVTVPELQIMPTKL
ncbi:MAG: SDR family oxidoreductase [Candidatus Solibacter sp.]